MSVNNKKPKFSKELIFDLYINQKLSTKQISSELNCVPSYVNYLLKKYEIPIRNKKEAVSLWFENNESPHLGKKRPEHSKRMSGENHHFYGKKRPDMAERFSGEKNPAFGKPVSEETRKKISLAGIGRRPPEETKKKISDFHKGKPKSEETKQKLSEIAYKRYENPENHPRWMGGISELNHLIRGQAVYIKWRTDCFIRDKNTCIFCKSKKDVCVDHIKPFALILQENNIKTVEEAEVCNELWDINNGRTLCGECHKKTETYGKHSEVLREVFYKNLVDEHTETM